VSDFSDNKVLSQDRQRRHKETAELAGAVIRLLRALGRRLASEDAELEQLRRIQSALDAAWLEAINGLRSHGMSDSEIGRELGVTKQAIQRRFPRDRTKDL
jgi:hypothetical protein